MNNLKIAIKNHPKIMENTKIKQIVSQGTNSWKKVEIATKYKVLVTEEHHDDDIYKNAEPWGF